jgi:(1->4)-alpha-D-glucan 1-alpha-D-glucosylmutase
VDWERRRRLLGDLLAGAAPTRETAKLFLIHRALALRRRRPEAFEGRYRPLAAGEGAFAYARGDEVLVAMPIRHGGGGERVAIPEDLRGSWRDVLGERAVKLGAEAMLAELAGPLPVVLLERVPADPR